MANVKITELPLITGITNNDIIPIVDVDTVVTSKVTIGDLKDYIDSPFTGGTVSGNTTFINGLTANTFSASTYQNLPTDVYVTGGTYSNNTFTYTNNISSSFDVKINDFTGLTINGNLNVTGNTIVDEITATTISATTYLGSGFDYLPGIYTTFTPNVTLSTFGNFAVNYINGIPIRIKSIVTIESLSFYVNASVVGNAVLGIYKYNPLGNWDLVAQTLGTIDASIIGKQELSFISPITLNPGIYCIVGNSNVIISTKVYPTSSLENIFGQLPSGISEYDLVQYVYTYDGTLPASFPLSLINFGPNTTWLIAAKIQ